MTISHSNPDQLHSQEGKFPGPIVKVDKNRLLEAVERLTATGGESSPDHARRFIKFAREHEIDLKTFFCRLNHQGGVLHSVLCVPNPGRTCMVFSTNPSNPSEADSIGGVIDHACGELGGAKLDLAQALLEPGETLLRDAYLIAGFSELAMLNYLERPLPTKRNRPQVQWPQGVSVQTYDETMWDELIGVLNDTYIDTLDCPGLFGLRRTDDILRGHQSSGEHDPALWTILRIDSVACGALLLNPSPASRAVELVYMGLSPMARGRGLGRQLLNHGLALLAGRNEHNISLAVDELNAPAQAVYRKAGFRSALRRRAMIRSLNSSAPTK